MLNPALTALLLATRSESHFSGIDSEFFCDHVQLDILGKCA